MGTIQRQLQQHLNRIQSWADENGFKISSVKSVCVHFRQLRRVHWDPELYINRDKIPVVGGKFLGLYVNRKLTNRKLQTSKLAKPMHLIWTDLEDQR